MWTSHTQNGIQWTNRGTACLALKSSCSIISVSIKYSNTTRRYAKDFSDFHYTLIIKGVGGFTRLPSDFVLEAVCCHILSLPAFLIGYFQPAIGQEVGNRTVRVVFMKKAVSLSSIPFDEQNAGGLHCINVWRLRRAPTACACPLLLPLSAYDLRSWWPLTMESI